MTAPRQKAAEQHGLEWRHDHALRMAVRHNIAIVASNWLIDIRMRGDAALRLLSALYESRIESAGDGVCGQRNFVRDT